MSKDRLGEIKRYWEIHYGSTIANGDIDWLISEVERLQQAHTTVVEHYNIACSENERLREALEQIVGMCSYTKYFDGSDWRDLVEEIKTKALATAKEE